MEGIKLKATYSEQGDLEDQDNVIKSNENNAYQHINLRGIQN